jgi:hypothetical protein
MTSDNKIELVVTVEVDKANQSIKSVNANLSSLESAASSAARGASKDIDGMTASMVKGATAGNLLADAIKEAVEWAKEWTVDAAKAAAQEERLIHAGEGLAKAHGQAGAAFKEAMEQVEELGIKGEDAAKMLNQILVADLGLEKAKGLAQLALNIHAIGNMDVGEAMQGLMRAIETGQTRTLRAAGVIVDFTKAQQIAELKLGRTLTENEAIQLRYQEVMRAGARISGAYASTEGDAEEQSRKLGVELEKLKETIGGEFQEDFRKLIQMLRDLVGWLKENSGLLVKFGEGAMMVAGLLATYALATKILSVAKAVTTLNLALAANPWALALTGIAAGGAIIYSTWKDTQAGLEAKGREVNLAGIRNQIAGGTSLADMKKRGYSEGDIREAMGGGRAIGDEGLGTPTGITVQGAGGPDVDALKLAAELRKQQIANEKFFRNRAAEAGAVGKAGYAKDVADLNAAIAKQTTYTDDKGVQHYVALTRAAWNSILTELQAKWAAFKEKTAADNRKNLAEYLKGQEEAHQKVMNFEAERFQQRLTYDAEIAQKNMDHVADLYRVEEARAGYERDAARRQLEGTDARTIQQKAAIEQRKADIEITYLQKVQEIKDKLFDIDTQRQVLEEQANMKRLGYTADQIKARIDELQGQRAEIKRAGQEEADASIQAARENAANRTAEMVREQNQRIFDSLKQQAGGVFDALLQKSQSVWSSIANSFKIAVLTAIKDVVTSRVAAMLMGLMGGGRASYASGGGGGAVGGGGILGGILGGGLLGGGSGGVAMGGGGLFGSGPVNGNPMILSAAGGTGAGGSSGGGILGMLGVKGGGGLAGLKEFLGFGGGVQYAPGMATTWGASTMGQKLSALGRSDAAGIAGGLLAFDGLRRGGFFGMGETTAGGAMIGFRYGGPIGAAIGAGVGLLAGIGRMFIKGATEKARAKIKSLYGVDISDKAILQQIVDTVKQAYGGNLDVGLRSPQIREIVQLYAMSTGKPTKGMPATMQSLTMTQTGGSLYSMPNYQNGIAQGTMMALDSIGRGSASGAGGTLVVPVQIDSKNVATVVVQNGRLMTQGVVNGVKANAGRRQLTSLQLSPGLITA